MNGEYVVSVVNNQIVGQPVPVDNYIQTGSSLGGWGGLVIVSILVLIIVSVLKGSIVMVHQQTVKVIQRLGKFNKIATAGLNFKIPFIDSIVGVMDLRIQQLGEQVVAKSKDNSFLTIPVNIQFEVVESSVKEAFYKLSDADNQIRAYITNIVRSKATSMKMEEIFESKDVFEEAVKSSLDQKFSDFGYKVLNVLVDNPLPSHEVVEAFNRVIASERVKEAATNEAEALRIKTVAGANAEAESLTLKAEAYVKQRKIMVEGMTGIIPDSEMANYLIGIDWRDTVRDASKNGSVVIVPQGQETMGNLLGAIKTANK